MGKRTGTASTDLGGGISFAGVEEGSVEKCNWDGHRIKIFDWFGL